MFRKWLNENNIRKFDFSGVIFEKASNREFWESKFQKEYVENAEQYLGYEWPLIRATDYIAFHTEGNRLKQEKPHFAKRAALETLFIGEIIEYKGRFIPDIVDGVFNICEESYWGLSAHRPVFSKKVLPDVRKHYIDLFAAETGSFLSIILYMLRDELYTFCPDIIERMEYELNERIVQPYLTSTDFCFMGYYWQVNNWNPWILSNVLTTYLFTEQNKTTLYSGIEKMIYEINNIYTGYPNDGGCDEGVSAYWSASGGAIFEFCEQLYRATSGKINFFQDEKIKKIADHPYKAYIGKNYFVNFADGCGKGGPAGSIPYYYGKRTNNENLSELAKEGFSKTNVLSGTFVKRILANIICYDALSAKSNLKLCESAVLPDIQNAFAREGNWYYAAKGGHNNENHNHNDVGSFIAYYDCEPVLVDPGTGVYTKQTFSSERYEIWTMQSAWHNTPVINGRQQLAGRKYCADGFGFANKTCKISFADAYEEGNGLNNLTRNISVSNDGIEITDKFEFHSPNNKISEHFVSPLNIEIRENAAIIDGKFILAVDCDAEISVDKQDFCGDEKLTSAWGTASMNRIIFKTIADNIKTIKITLRRV